MRKVQVGSIVEVQIGDEIFLGVVRMKNEFLHGSYLADVDLHGEIKTFFTTRGKDAFCKIVYVHAAR